MSGADDSSASDSSATSSDVINWERFYPRALAEREAARTIRRRAAAQVGADAGTVGIACSGGGIRSATVCLGFFQALARAGHLSRVDYISTVSGGGYFGSFLGTLFMRSAQLGCTAREALSNSQSRPIAWLREFGRYIAPKGAADYPNIVGVYTRNWLGLHYVIGLTILTLSLAFIECLALVDRFVIAWSGYDVLYWQGRLPEVVQAQSVVWSPLFLASLCLVVVTFAPLVWSYWLTQYGYRHDGVTPSPGAFQLLRRNNPLLAHVIVLGTMYWLHAYVLQENGIARTAVAVGLAVGALATLYWLLAEFWPAPETPEEEALRAETPAAQPALLLKQRHARVRNRLSRALAASVTLLACAFALAFIDTAARALSDTKAAFTWMPAGVVAISTVLHRLLPLLAKATRIRALLSSSTLAPLAGFLLFALLVIAWHTVGHVIAVSAFPHPPATGLQTPLEVALALGIAISVITGWTLSFINFSSLQQFYSARLRRAYLGATNPVRQSSTGPEAVRAVTKDIRGDDTTWSSYAPDEHGGPQHILGVTLNHTVEGASNIELHDRKGRQMAIGAAGVSVGSDAHAVWSGTMLEALTRDEIFRTDGPLPAEECSLSRWMAVSGAAFSTGLGARTQTGLSLLLGIANVRLGYWWASGQQTETRWQPIRRAFRTQWYLYEELTGAFEGAAERHWYLSDGGHAENTGAYELIRRRLRYIVVLDNGADPHYQFDDFANLVRRVRIDFAVDVRVADPAAVAEELGIAPDVVGALDECVSGRQASSRIEPASRRIAAFDILYPDGHPSSLLLLVKPTLVGNEPADVTQYATSHPLFPQEPTADQFFDEAQWESYRRLGETAGERLFVRGFHFG